MLVYSPIKIFLYYLNSYLIRFKNDTQRKGQVKQYPYEVYNSPLFEEFTLIKHISIEWV